MIEPAAGSHAAGSIGLRLGRVSRKTRIAPDIRRMPTWPERVEIVGFGAGRAAAARTRGTLFSDSTGANIAGWGRCVSRPAGVAGWAMH
jgi:hypothetical protein